MARKKGETRVKIYHDWCKGCGICVAFCPSNVLKLGNRGKADVVQEDECINCGFCEVHCPDFAVSVRPRKGADKSTAVKKMDVTAVPQKQGAEVPDKK